MKGILAFDFDNTLVDCITSDYSIYSMTCSHLAVPPMNFDDYQVLRKSGRIHDILCKDNILDEKKFFEVRKAVAKSEELCLNDSAIVDTDLLEQLSDRYQFFIISSRNSPDVLKRQVEKAQLGRYFTVIAVPTGNSETVAEAKRRHLCEIGASFFVGDKDSDIAATRSTNSRPIAVNTGFGECPSGAPVFSDVNDFLRTLI